MHRHGFGWSMFYMALLGILATPLGRLMARLPLNGKRFPFQALPFEKNGKLYEKLGIRRWKNKVPDMSKILTKILPPKKVPFRDDVEKLEVLVKETCVAESVHIILCLLGLGLLAIWPGPGGMVMTALYLLLGNLPFIVIQRYNRPRLLSLLEKKRAVH